MNILSLLGLMTTRQAHELAAQERINGRQEGIDAAATYFPGRELIEFSRIGRKFRFRIVTNVADDAQAFDNLQQLLITQLGITESKARELAGFIADNAKILKAPDEQLFF